MRQGPQPVARVYLRYRVLLRQGAGSTRSKKNEQKVSRDRASVGGKRASSIRLCAKRVALCRTVPRGAGLALRLAATGIELAQYSCLIGRMFPQICMFGDKFPKK